MPSRNIVFPSLQLAGEDGLLCIGGDLKPDMLLTAYRSGIFPWYNEGEPICWYSPDPRFVLFPSELRISNSMKQLLKKNSFDFTENKAFSKVMEHCRDAERPGQSGTWIHQDMIDAYNELHQLGFAHSYETWQDGKLVGGLYGVKIGKVFFGESMFSLVSNASKYAFISFIKGSPDLELVDCQVYSLHLETLGARMIERSEFVSLLKSFT